MKKRLSNSLHEILMESELTKLKILTENQLPLKKNNNKNHKTKTRTKDLLQLGSSNLITTRELHYKSHKWHKMVVHQEKYDRVIYEICPGLALKEVFRGRHQG